MNQRWFRLGSEKVNTQIDFSLVSVNEYESIMAELKRIAYEIAMEGEDDGLRIVDAG